MRKGGKFIQKKGIPTKKCVDTPGMKRYILAFLMLMIFAIAGSLLLLTSSCSPTTAPKDYIRIHVRANSDSTEDQSVKLAVRDAIVQYLAPLSVGIDSKEKMWDLLQNKAEEIKKTANDTLVGCGYEYGCRVRLAKENFPSRRYGDLTLQAGEYDAVIVELGSGEGKNWWCVAYPPLCFVAAKETGKEEVEYRSWIAELLRK